MSENLQKNTAIRDLHDLSDVRMSLISDYEMYG